MLPVLFNQRRLLCMFSSESISGSNNTLWQWAKKPFTSHSTTALVAEKHLFWHSWYSVKSHFPKGWASEQPVYLINCGLLRRMSVAVQKQSLEHFSVILMHTDLQFHQVCCCAGPPQRLFIAFLLFVKQFLQLKHQNLSRFWSSVCVKWEQIVTEKQRKHKALNYECKGTICIIRFI